MRIGLFASNNKISIDTARYYMELKLILPERIGGQYEFDDKCQSDLEEILWLKSADFTLNEIQRIFSLKRLTSLKDDEDMQYYMSRFQDKKQELLHKRNELDRIIDKLEQKTVELENMKIHNGMRLGVPIDFLQLLSCPDCGARLKLVSANIENGMVMDGRLSCCCSCEHETANLEINDGIIVNLSDCINSPHHEPEIDGHFIEQTSSDYVNLLYKSGQWISAKLDLAKANNLVMLEPGTGSGLFLNAILNELSSECTYVCVDHNLGLLKNTKETIEKHRSDLNIVFICCDFRRIPVCNSSIDVLIDHFGTTNYNFYNEGFLVHLLDRLVKPGGKWLGDYLYFKPGAKSLDQFEKRFQSYFYKESIMDALKSSSFDALEIKEMGYTQKGGIYETFFIEGDTLYDFVYYGEKEKQPAKDF